jgi:hypothetical protein
MDPKLTSVYVNKGGEWFRIGFDTLENLKGGSFKLDKKEYKRLDEALAVPPPAPEGSEGPTQGDSAQDTSEPKRRGRGKAKSQPEQVVDTPVLEDEVSKQG